MNKKQLFTLPLYLGAFLLTANAVQAAAYKVVVNTSSISGQAGSIDFQFNPGVGVFQSATAQVSNFSTDGTYGGMQTIYGSGVTGGPVPSVLTLANVGGQDNEVLDTFKFGSALSFTLNFTGPAITSPNGSDTAGSLFTFSMFKDAAGLTPVLTNDPNGVALDVNLSTQGVLSSTVLATGSVLTITPTPEPSSMALLAAPLALLGMMLLRRRNVRA